MFYLSEKTLKLAPYFLQGAIFMPLRQFFSKFKPKKSNAHSNYLIIAAVYNVEKYLDDFFTSIIKQRLDFKQNIKLICVDDGSTDSSAKIIKAYAARFPKNIIYLHKENAGLASARNFGLAYLKKEPQLNAKWLSFVDSDDFLHRDYFYEIDSFLNRQKDDLAMISCNMIFYREKRLIRYKDTHSLNYRFKNKETILEIKNLNHFIQLSVNSILIKCSSLPSMLKFDELAAVEDAPFVNEFLLANLNQKAAFLKNALYFYRKRADKSSIMDNFSTHKAFLNMPKIPLSLLKQSQLPFIQNIALFYLFWQLKDCINVSRIKALSKDEQAEYLSLLEQNFAYIKAQNIEEFKFTGFDYFYKLGLLSCFKKARPLKELIFIKEFDEKKDEILLSFFSMDAKDELSFFFDEKQSLASAIKIAQYDLMGRIFCYEKRIWLKVPQHSKSLKILVNNKQIFISFKNKEFEILNASLLNGEFTRLKKKRKKNAPLWLVADRLDSADDNGEHFYRHLMKKQQRAYFVLSKHSKDYARLKKEGFKLVCPKSFYFVYLLFQADKIISSHLDRYLYGAFGANTLKTKHFIFLQHGIIKNDISAWLNLRKIDLFITATQNEYDSIAGDFTHYKLTQKEVQLTGLARHDALLTPQMQKRQILVMPTWRRSIVGEFSKKLGTRRLNKNFTQSAFFKEWQGFFQSKELERICKEYDYSIIFNPHPDIKPYIKDFKLPVYIKIFNKKSLQGLFKSSALLITDYSSVAFEMGYLSKPVLYYQFDKKDFFKSQWERGYFSYKKDGFGPVKKNLQGLLKELESLLKNDCKLPKSYEANFTNTFKFKDGQCRERIYEAILALDEK
ncbi:CDP-glycerol glycerophosphotransferase family protein [Campylobacter troglodytis]|uniref:CDP-glycerol glycerophosphotransferase family protein n=1 Tax=Campylobacter troglodytis TaxID=654363 RepID=UPI00115A41BD|nr:CDP-glycerol glycerophosphotransferase family protein [Campylobacter troglodytis]TQR60378.1 capsular biosynthesis protein [Campylobacter troglodytis]